LDGEGSHASNSPLCLAVVSAHACYLHFSCGFGQKPATAAQPVLGNPIFVLTAFLPSENHPLTRQIKVLFSKLLCNFDPTWSAPGDRVYFPRSLKRTGRFQKNIVSKAR
jgi:hypothetical protein